MSSHVTRSSPSLRRGRGGGTKNQVASTVPTCRQAQAVAGAQAAGMEAARAQGRAAQGGRAPGAGPGGCVASCRAALAGCGQGGVRPAGCSKGSGTARGARSAAHVGERHVLRLVLPEQQRAQLQVVGREGAPAGGRGGGWMWRQCVTRGPGSRAPAASPGCEPRARAKPPFVDRCAARQLSTQLPTQGLPAASQPRNSPPPGPLVTPRPRTTPRATAPDPRPKPPRPPPTWACCFILCISTLTEFSLAPEGRC